tara:strand:- start:2708 stop:4045 length:1338 start_codon:yes stop_codon:yes gene_type:complete
MILNIIKDYNGICIIDKTGSYSFSDLIKKIENYKKELKSQISDFDNVVIYSDYNFFSIALLIYLSTRKINIIPIVKSTQSELDSKIKESQPNIILSINNDGDTVIEKIYNQASNNDIKNKLLQQGDTGIILFSSGTSGKPKVMVQNFSKLINNIPKPKRQKSLIFLIFLMFDHIGGLNTLLNCILTGAPIVIPRNRKPATVIGLIEKYKINVLPTSPTFLNLLLMDDFFSTNKFESLRLITYGTERMPHPLLNRLRKKLPKVRLLQTFGTSETGIVKTVSKSSDSLFFKINDSEQDFKIVDNELYLKSKTSVDGYLNHDSSSFKYDGWYATGDIVVQDSEGFIKIIGRKNKIINVGGLKVLPSEIEEVINEVEGVLDCSVYSEENIITGNIVCVKIYTDLKNTINLKKHIKKKCISELDKYKRPVKFTFNELKINKRGKKDEKNK